MTKFQVIYKTSDGNLTMFHVKAPQDSFNLAFFLARGEIKDFGEEDGWEIVSICNAEAPSIQVAKVKTKIVTIKRTSK